MQEAQNTQADSSLPAGTEELVAQIIEPTFGGGQSVPDSLPETGPEKEAAETTESKSNPFLQIKWKGQTKELDRKKAEIYAQKGFDYEQNVADLKKERAQLRAQMERFSKYGDDDGRLDELFQLDEYSRKNPDFLALVKQEWQKRSQGQAGQSTEESSLSTHPLLNELAEKVSALEKAHTEAEVGYASKQLDSDIAELKQSFEFLDWDKSDDFGYTPEHKVLQLIADKGIGAKEALWMVYGEQIAEHKAAEAAKKREESYKENFKKTRAINAFYNSKNVSKARPSTSGMSYDDIGKQILKDLNIN